MKYLSSTILSLALLVLWSCSDMGDPVSCSEGLDCTGECGGVAVLDCAGTCNGAAILDGDNCTNISYSATIQPIFSTAELCTSCHTEEDGSGGLSLESYENLISDDVVANRDSTNSKLIKRLKGDGVTQMPLGKNALDAQIITLIATWIQEGAINN